MTTPQADIPMTIRTERTATVKKLLTIAAALLMLVSVAGCKSDADVVSENASKAADNFEILRRVVFYNGITGEYMLTIEGFCSLGNHDSAGTLSVVCKTGPTDFKKHFLGLSDNVTYFVEQLTSANVSTDHYRVVFKPSVIIPDVDVR
jgi:hypothetical protein